MDDYVTLWNQKSHLKDFYNRLIRKCMSIMGVAPSKIKDMAYHQHYGIFLDQIMQNDILFSTGGDMMCMMTTKWFTPIIIFIKRG